MRVARLALLLGAASCGKVPLHDIDATFVLADATWFDEEDTLFVFFEVHAAQGISEHSVVEITYTTDEEEVPWTPLSELPSVHTHLPVACTASPWGAPRAGAGALCGSASVRVPDVPRELSLRMRYHRDGELALPAYAVFNVVGPGAAHTHRSLLVYGVFDETNQRVQWRSRHQFPTLRNQQVEGLGLRREVVVEDQRFGTGDLTSETNPYGYGVPCPEPFEATELPALTLLERARFNAEDLPLAASEASTVCAQVTVPDASGAFVTGAVARKNPEVRPAFPVLRSPVRDATQLRFFLAPCDRTISEDHEAMQRQRLLLGSLPTTCTDGWRERDFANELVVAFRDAVEAARPAGNDMVLVVGLHQDEAGLAGVVEQALAEVVPDERFRSSPRLAGAFVLDSTPRGLSSPDLAPVTLWCPSTLSFDTLPDASSRACPVAPDNPDFELGPFSFGALPILPSREQYLDFIDTYSVRQAGSVQTLAFRTPEFSTLADHIDVGFYGVATFLNNERFDADPADAFSYCVSDELQLFVFRTELIRSDAFAAAIERACEEGVIPAEICESAEGGLAPLQWLPEWHNTYREEAYELGVLWEFPFLLRMTYELVQAGSVSAFGLSVPFGVATPGASYYGTEVWTEDEFRLAEALTQCTRFCDHPTFDSAGVYQPSAPFRATYEQTCYLPLHPQVGDSGAPLDP